MKALRIVPLLATLLLTMRLSASAQNAGSQEPDSLPATVSAARCQYTPADEACGVDGQSEVSENASLAQFPPPHSGPPMQRRPMAYPASYPRGGMASGRRVAIGAAIGFGLGAVIGARAGRDQPTGTTIKVSALFGAIGAAMGAAFASTPSFRSGGWGGSRPRRGGWRHRKFDDGDETASATASKPRPDSAEINTASGQ